MLPVKVEPTGTSLCMVGANALLGTICHRHCLALESDREGQEEMLVTGLDAFHSALRIQPHFYLYQGLVELYLAVPRKNNFEVARRHAKEVLAKTPRNVNAISLHATVLSHHHKSRGKAKDQFKEALLLDPSCSMAVIGLSRIYSKEQDYRSATKLFLKHVDKIHYGREVIYSTLADTFRVMEEFGEALTYYKKALQINPHYTKALLGSADMEDISHIPETDE